MVWTSKTYSSFASLLHSVSSRKSLYPLAHYVTCDKFSTAHRNFLAYVSAVSEPNQFADAIFDPKWRAALKLEIDALEHYGTWELTFSPPGKHALGSK